jgi:hypothetical protein
LDGSPTATQQPSISKEKEQREMDQPRETTKRRRERNTPNSYGMVRCALVVGLVIFMASFGCNKRGLNRAAISGAIQLDGKLLENGGILFVPTKDTKGPITGGPIKNGQYELRREVGPVVGWHRVEIHATRKTGRMVAAPFTKPGEGKMIEEQEEAVAPRFNENSTLEVEVKSGDNTADFSVFSE